MLIDLIKAVAPGRQEVTEEEVEAWAEYLQKHGDEGTYFYSLNRYLFIATKPGLR